ncbi:MAG TPA: polymer-forming cytoskeletal protein [Candidatus Saccharimonadales bacterium]|jgi:cytoskeletal protein CcmA (bactofilin family)|nr:polymer-forming cytoskeletal protein [Candidatus Saccharimonadales bacterium]
MWKRPEDKPHTATPASQPGAGATTAAATPVRESRPLEMTKTGESSRHDVAAHIGKSVLVKGELSGSEDLYLDGEVEGVIELRDHSLVIGPNGRIRASISAREVVIHGRVEGNVNASERAELKKSCVLIGDVSTQRIVIEDGAFFKGSVDLKKDSKGDVRKPVPASGQPAVNSGASAAPQSSLLEH